MGNFLKIEAKIDFLYGAIFGSIPLLFGAGWFGLITVPACALLYAMGGDNDWRSVWRDVGCSAVNAIGLILATGNLLFLGAGVATYGLLTVGLGLPSIQPPDTGSPVGRLAWKLAQRVAHTVEDVELVANFYTHLFLYVTTWLVYMAASVLRGVLWP